MNHVITNWGTLFEPYFPIKLYLFILVTLLKWSWWSLK